MDGTSATGIDIRYAWIDYVTVKVCARESDGKRPEVPAGINNDVKASATSNT
jgi:hypothetical protein